MSKNITVAPCITCKTPADVTITSTDTDLTLCPGGSTTLSTNSQANATDFDYTWYKNGTIVAGPIVGATLSKSVLYADAGTYIVLVRDQSKPTMATCHKSDTVVINTAPFPTYTISGTQTVCQGATITQPQIDFTLGTQPFVITWNQTGTATATCSVCRWRHTTAGARPAPTVRNRATR